MDFVLDYKLILDVCKCCRLLSKKEASLGLVCSAGRLHIFAYDHQSVVESYVDVGKSLDFSVGVNLDKFLAVSKRLYEGKVSFKIKAKKLNLRQGNTSARFPILEGVQEPAACSELKPVEVESVQWFLGSLILCSESIVKSDKYQGILVDQVGQFVRVGKFSSVSITLVTGNGNLVISDSVRYVIPPDIIATVQTAKLEVESIHLSDNWVAFILKGGVTLRSCLLTDGFPSDYLGALGLVDRGKLIDEDQYNKYIFDRDEFFSAVDAVMLVSDNKRAQVKFKMLGFEEETGLLVWSVKCSSQDNSMLEEKFKCAELLEASTLSDFKISGFDLANSLKSRAESICLYASDEKPVVAVSDLEGSRVTMLVKSVG